MNRNILFFDGVCHLCNGYIDFLSRFNTDQIFYAPLQGTTALQHLTDHQREKLESLLYLKNETVFEKSTAVIESMGDANTFFKILKIFYLIPAFIRDTIYDFVARRRYQLFGKRESCRIPTVEEKKYTLD